MLSSATEVNDVIVPWHITEDQGERLNVMGTAMRVKVNGSHDGPTFSIMDVEIPHGVEVPLHTHAEAEVFHIIAGELEFIQQAPSGESEVRRAGPGEFVVIPRSSPHGFCNVSGARARALVICEPGLQEFFQEVGRGPVTQGPPSPDKIRRVISIAQRHGLQFFGG
jgi:quercetin dioxygenase-like cupin family protein